VEETLLSPTYWQQYQPALVQEKFLNSPIKRFFDIIGAVVGLVLASPLLVLAAGIIKFVDGVPTIFSQPRLGLRGAPFVFYKLKTLTIVETSDMLTSQKMERKPVIDPDLTRTGRFWRTTSIDEIPQFWNVIKGDMSLVGYRPFPYYYVPRLNELPRLDEERVQNYLNIICQFKPGVTSLSSIKGRSKLTMQEKMEYDMIYALKADFWYDVRIILRTVVIVITREGAW
jgi:sugar transferase EpsL